MKKTLITGAVAGLLLAACGGDDNNGATGPRFMQLLAVPGLGAGTNYSFDITPSRARPTTTPIETTRRWMWSTSRR